MRPAKRTPAQSKAQRLESKFNLDAGAEDRLKISLAPLDRPIECTAAIYPSCSIADEAGSQVKLPKRPKWKSDWTKAELEGAESSSFAAWLDRTNSPGMFERNLEVWRQFWRVTEISQILLILLDSRCPPLHIPPALTNFVRGKKVIWILTKSDMVPPSYLLHWQRWLSARNIQAIPVSTYTGKIRKIPRQDLQKIIDAIKSEATSIDISVDWTMLLEPPLNHTENPEYLTVGLIGQPNAGKSSLLNALVGKSRVRASATPGKTKHLQTIYWTPSIRLVDCPGLVWPSDARMDMQVLAGILPISQVRSPAAVLKYIANIMPLETVLHLKFEKDEEIVDKRTWRAGTEPASRAAKNPQSLCTLDLLEIYAVKLGFLTAKAGRPDHNRAGNYLLRQIARSDIPWAFLPDTTPTNDLMSTENNGIWLPGFTQRSTLHEESAGEDNAASDSDDDDDEGSSSASEDKMIAPKGSMFSALALSDSDGSHERGNSDDHIQN